MPPGPERKCFLSMATLARRTSTSSRPKTTSISVKRRPNPQIVKLQQRLASAAKRAKGKGTSRIDKERTLLTVAGPVAIAMLEKKGVQIPTVGGIDPTLLIGAGLSLLAPRYVAGVNGQRLQALGDGVLALAAARAVTRGGVKVGGVDDDDDTLAGVEIDD